MSAFIARLRSIFWGSGNQGKVIFGGVHMDIRMLNLNWGKINKSHKYENGQLLMFLGTTIIMLKLAEITGVTI